jgi:transposase
MGRRAVFTQDAVDLAQQIVDNASTVREVKAGLSVILSAKAGMGSAEIAAALGLGLATVSRMHEELRRRAAGVAESRGKWGDRRNELLTETEEDEFLRQWEDQAAEGGGLTVGPIHEALERRVGRTVAPCTVYRMLARHGWRRVQPDKAHPKRDPEAQEAFKKGASRMAWRKR